MNNDFETVSAEFRKKQALIHEARNRPRSKFTFPKVLEKQYSAHFSELSKQSFKTSYLFMIIPILLIMYLGVMGITFEEFLDTLLAALLSLIALKPALHGTVGVYVMHIFALSLFIVLWPMQKTGFFQQHFQLILSIASAIILSLIAVTLAMATDPRYIFSQQMELVATYLFVFVLLQMQVIYLLINQLLALLLIGFISLNFHLQADWIKFSALALTMSVFGFVFAFLREIHERDNFLLLTEIENEKQQFEFLHKQIEKENLLKAELSRFYAVMSGEKDLYILGQKILSFLVPELKANIASLYIAKGDKLILVAQHGLSNHKKIRQEIPLGEGLLGQCALEKKQLTLNHSTESFHSIQSGLGKIDAPAITINPMLFDDELIGVMELASIKPLNIDSLEFLDAANRSVSTALRAVSAKTDFS